MNDRSLAILGYDVRKPTLGAKLDSPTVLQCAVSARGVRAANTTSKAMKAAAARTLLLLKGADDAVGIPSCR
jgi:hypothetical protein